MTTTTLPPVTGFPVPGATHHSLGTFGSPVVFSEVTEARRLRVLAAVALVAGLVAVTFLTLAVTIVSVTA